MQLLAASGAFAHVDQHYLLAARQMEALSFAVHVPLVAFGISFPAMVLFVEWLGQRGAGALSRGDVHPVTEAGATRGVVGNVRLPGRLWVASLIASFGLLSLAKP